MRQVKFEQLNSELWQQLERVLDDLDLSKRKRQLAGSEHERLPELYRKTCNHYALAQSRHYSPALEGPSCTVWCCADTAVCIVGVVPAFGDCSVLSALNSQDSTAECPLFLACNGPISVTCDAG